MSRLRENGCVCSLGRDWKSKERNKILLSVAGLVWWVSGGLVWLAQAQTAKEKEKGYIKGPFGLVFGFKWPIECCLCFVYSLEK